MKAKTILISAALTALASTPAISANWVKFKECRTNQGQLWLDRATDGPWVQIVIRDPQLIQYLDDRSAVDKGDLDFLNQQFVMGSYGNSTQIGAAYNFHGDATFRSGKPGLDVNLVSNGVRLSAGSHQTLWYKCYCDGYTNGDSQCVGTYRCPTPVALFDFTVTNCKSL